MAILPVRLYPDPVLREPAAPVVEIDDGIKKLVSDMGETMRAAPGIGLAAPQVGVQRRVLVYSLSEEEDVVALINPEIVEQNGEEKDSEGCLSMPGISFDVARATQVIVRGLNLDGETIEIDAVELEARVLQHEIDHLNGILFIDRIDPEEKKEALRLMRERDMAADVRSSTRL